MMCLNTCVLALVKDCKDRCSYTNSSDSIGQLSVS